MASKTIKPGVIEELLRSLRVCPRRLRLLVSCGDYLYRYPHRDNELTDEHGKK